MTQSSSELNESLARDGADDPGEMALVDEPEIGGEDREILLPVDQTVERDCDADLVPELRERHPGDLGEHAADVKARVTERPGQVAEVRARRVRDDRLASLLNDAAVIGSSCRAAGCEASRDGAFGQGAHKLCEPLVDFEPIDPPA